MLPLKCHNEVTQKTISTMKASDLKKGSKVEVRVNYSPEKMNQPVEVIIDRATDFYIWFKHNHMQRISRNTFQNLIDNFEHKIISI